MQQHDIGTLCDKLDRLIQLTALSVIDGKDQQEKMSILSQAGFQPKEIAHIIGTTPNAVSVYLSKSRKKTKTGKDTTKRRKQHGELHH